MFYSQFILAKKGPLGTIWIAAHLERKLRKNQVADTDIGDSVDSILFPDVPIALRLSSHLLLGVVRIYNRKVNYLFDDCSEALLKIKQAFRSTAVDLPPEESKAPYHSITLPEKFDLDDFELPDSDIFQGNYVDHHISSREQITLQDTMEGVSYSTSKFGLDERFGDGDASGLDLDEELLLGKIGSEGHADERADPQASFGPSSTVKQDQHSEDMAANSEALVDGVDEYADIMDDAQAPRTPGLVEEPNLPNIQDASACDDHLEPEYHLMESTIREDTNIAPYEDKQEVDWCSRDDTISDAVPQGPSKEDGCLFGGLEVIDSESQGQIESIRPASAFTNEVIEASDVPCQEDLPTEAINEDQRYLLSVDESCRNHQGPNEIGLEDSATRISGLASATQQVSVDVSLSPLGGEVLGETSNQQESGHGGSELASAYQVGCVETPETQAFRGPTGSSTLNLDAHDKETASETLILRPCKSIREDFDVTKPGFSMSSDGDVKSNSNVLETADGREHTENLGKACCANDNSEQNLRNQVEEHASGEDIQVAAGEADGPVHTMNSHDPSVENLNNSAESELPAPEKLLSVPEGHMDLHRGVMTEVNPVDFEGLDDGDTGSKSVAGRKRTFTESTLTEQSLNSVESSRQVRFKQTTGSIPDDDDLLSSILVGRSSILRVKPTPPLSEVTSMKRTRSAPRSGAPKRKVLMDDTMVLHGDTIRQQLTNTEDIRRVRKKAPCTLPEISMIQKQQMEDEIFLQPILTGISVELASLHGQVHDLSRIRVCQNEVNDASLESVTEPRLPCQNDENGVPLETMFEPNLASQGEKSGASVETMAELHLISPNNGNHYEEDHEGPGKTNVLEISWQRLNDEFLTVRNNETAQPSVSLLPSENKPEEVDDTSIASPPVIAEVEPLVSTGHATADMTDAPDGMVQTASLNESEPLYSTGHATADMGVAPDGTVQTASLIESGDPNAYVNTDTAVVPDQKEAALSVELDYAALDDGQAIVGNEVREKDSYASGEVESELGAKDHILPDVTQDGADVGLVSNGNNGELEYLAHSEVYGAKSTEQQEVEFSCPGLEGMLQDGSINNYQNPEAYQPNMIGAEFSGFDLHDHDELNYPAAGNDTEFLNFDDDELTDMADDGMPDAEEARYTENSGWSSRTRAVSKYLQAAFVKEAEHGRKSLHMENLLVGKSRKEASRMFFETLVLKTRDYIHVEQQNPFDGITIKPRTRLMKSDF